VVTAGLMARRTARSTRQKISNARQITVINAWMRRFDLSSMGDTAKRSFEVAVAALHHLLSFVTSQDLGGVGVDQRHNFPVGADADLGNQVAGDASSGGDGGHFGGYLRLGLVVAAPRPPMTALSSSSARAHLRARLVTAAAALPEDHTNTRRS
jgi:hypothetical protein